MPVWKHLNADADRGLARYVREEACRRVFRGEETLMSILVPIGWAYTGDFQAAPPGGSQAFVAYLQRRIEELGSTIVTGTAVEQVVVADGRAVGVRLESGQTISSRYVLACCDVEALYERMVPSGLVPDRLRARLAEAELYESEVSIFLGLDCDPADLGFGPEILYLSRDDVSPEEMHGSDPGKCTLTVLAPSTRDPSLAPPGKGTLTVHVYPAGIDHADFWKTEPGLRRGEAYRDFKQAYARTAIERVARAMAPGLADRIEVMSVATPVTYWRYTGNRRGSIMGARPGKKNIRSGIAHYRTPIDGLFLGGQWAEIGGGVPVAVKAAANATLLILAESNPVEHRKLVAAMAGLCRRQER